MVTIPLTAIINLIYVKANREQRAAAVMGRCFLVAAIVPIVFMALTFLGLLLE